MEQKIADKMMVYFSNKTITGEVPENILNDVKDFTKFQIEHLTDGTVVVKVPEKEIEIARKLREDIYQLLTEIKNENSVLAGKLARKYKYGPSF